MTFLEQMQAIGALKSGHFLLASGRHSAQYMEKFDLLRQPKATERACTDMIGLLGDTSSIDLVVGPTTGGILLAFEVARQLELPAAYAERIVDGGNERGFKRDTTIAPGTRVLVVDDILTTGGSVFQTLAALEKVGATTQAIAVLVDRSGGTVPFPAPLVSLAHLTIDTWSPDDCPMCAAGEPVIKPGSTAAGMAGAA